RLVTEPIKFAWMDSTCFLCLPDKQKKIRGNPSFILMMMHRWSPCDTTTGSWYLWSSVPREHFRYGQNHLLYSGCLRYITLELILMKLRISLPIHITTGCWIMPGCSFLHSLMWVVL